MSTMIQAPLVEHVEVPASAVDPAPALAAPDHFVPMLSVEPKWYRRTWLVAALVIVSLYAGLVLRLWASGDAGVDQNAYLVGGRLLAQNGSMKYQLPNPYSFVGGMWVRITPPTDANGKFIPNGVYYPKYPIGLPLLYACFFWGFHAIAAIPFFQHHVNPHAIGYIPIADWGSYYAFLVSPLSAVAGVLGMFMLARQVSGSFAAALAAILLGTSQLMLMLADNPNSHAACMAFIVWGMFFLVRWMQTGSIWRGILGGLLVGYAATIRWNEMTLFVALCVVVLSRLPWNRWSTWRDVGCAVLLAAGGYLVYYHWQAHVAGKLDPSVAWTTFYAVEIDIATILLLGGAAAAGTFAALRNRWPEWRMYIMAIIPGLAWSIPVVALMALNYHTMGSLTGYDSTHESEFGAAFQWHFFFDNWEKVVRVFVDLGLFFVVPFAVAGIFMIFRRSWRIGLLLLGWVVPGVMLYMSYYWSPDRADAYARFFLTYLPALLVGTAVCFHDGILAGRKAVANFDGSAVKISLAILLLWLLPGVLFYVFHYLMAGHSSVLAQIGLIYLPTAAALTAIGFHDWPLMMHNASARPGRIALTIAVGMVVAIAAGISVYRTVDGLRDGSESTKIPLDDFRERLALAQTGQMLMQNVPAKSVLFADTSGIVAMPAYDMQFLRDWEMYPIDAFSFEGSRRGFGGGGNVRRRNNNNNNNNNNFRGGPGGGRFRNNGRGGGGGGGGRFGRGGPGGGGAGGGRFGNQNNNDPNAVTATPVQPEQGEYHAALYSDIGARQLYGLEAAVIQKAFSQHQRVFVVVGVEDTHQSDTGESLFSTGESSGDALRTFKEDLGEAGHFTYKTVALWQDVRLPVEKQEDQDDNHWANFGGGGRNPMNRIFMAANRILDWKLVEVMPGR